MGEEEKKLTASSVLFENVYQISEDLIATTYQLVERLTGYETLFGCLAHKLDHVNGNIENISNKIKGPDKKLCLAKIAQSKELMDICGQYSKACRAAANKIILTTEHFEDNKKVSDIVKNIIAKIDAEKKKPKQLPPPEPPPEKRDAQDSD